MIKSELNGSVVRLKKEKNVKHKDFFKSMLYIYIGYIQPKAFWIKYKQVIKSNLVYYEKSGI
jgi:hypothetical protein